jgi:GAF domain-containing protein
MRSGRIGVLYLENRLSNGVFTAGKSRMTELLTMQAAMALENARLIDELHALRERSKKPPAGSRMSGTQMLREEE